VDGILERSAVTVLSGDTGSGKSLVALSMGIAVMCGRPWLGRAVKPGPVILSDAEMVEREAVDRLRGFGVRGADDKRFVYLNRQAIDLGVAESVDALSDLCGRREASALILDALMGHAPSVDVNDNSQAVALYAEVLRPLAVELGLAVLLVHHESKPRQGPRDSSLATMGARQWVGQADVQLTLERAPKPSTKITTEPDNALLTTSRLRMRQPKRRDAPDPHTFERLRVVSRRDPTGALDWLSVELDDDDAPAAASDGRDHSQERAERLGAFVKGHGESTSAEMAAEVGLNPSSGTYKRARDLALEKGLFKRVKKGIYL